MGQHLPLFFSRTATLFEYLPDDSLLLNLLGDADSKFEQSVSKKGGWR